MTQFATVTGNSADPTAIAWRFSPVSNGKRQQVTPAQELRVLVSTDVLSEGQNLQDCSVILNYDLPWAIIRLIQRAGRVDRIGQKSEKILCYSFLPAEGVERLINLRGRLRDRLQENAEVVGTDEAFFEDEAQRELLLNLYHEKAGMLDEEEEGDVDLISEALQIWQNAIAKLNQGFKSGITDDQLAKLVVFLREQDAFCIINAEDDQAEAQIICSMGLFQGENNGGLR